MVGGSSFALKSAISSSFQLFPTKLPLPLSRNRFTVLPVSATAVSSSSQFTHPLKSEMSLCVGTHLIPHPRKIETGGEDAFCTSSYGGGAIAVADGVSGWAELGVDPAWFSREFIANVSSMVEDAEVNHDPQILLRKAHAATSSIGSATVIVAMMERNGLLKIANVGDCGLRVIRKGQIMFSTHPQEHYFDCPYQLSSEDTGQTYLDAVVSSVELKEGDVVVMGSDGLYDNVFDQEIVSTVISHNDVTEAAKALASLARQHSVDFYFDSPYSLKARAKGVEFPSWKKMLGMKLTGIDSLSSLVTTLLCYFLCSLTFCLLFFVSFHVIQREYYFTVLSW